MTVPNKRKKVRSVLKWVMWVLIAQLLLINFSAALYGYKLTYFYEAHTNPSPAPRNIFTKTWRLFTGPQFQKSVVEEIPHFSYQTIQLITKDKLHIEGWYIPVDSAKGTVILVHGLGGNKSILLSQAYEFRYFGFNVLLIDLRAHGNSDGNVTTLGYSESEEVKLAYDYVSSRGQRNIILYGISLGAAVISKAVADFDLSPSRIILEIPFNSQEELFAKRGTLLGFPEEPFGVLVTFWASVERGFNAFKEKTSKYVRKIKCPVLLEYAARDELVPEEETISIFKNIASKDKRLVKFQNANHEFLLNKEREKWREEISLFLFK